MKTLATRLACVSLMLAIGCVSGPPPNSDEHLKLRAEAFYSAWKNGNVDLMRVFPSAAFRDDDPNLAALETMAKRKPIKAFQIINVENELTFKRVTASVTDDSGKVRSQVSYWRFERGDWYLEVLD